MIHFPNISCFTHRALGSQHTGTAFVYSHRCFSQTTALQESKTVPGIYVANIEGRQNSSPILLGLTDYFERHMSSVGFFQPVRIILSALLCLFNGNFQTTLSSPFRCLGKPSQTQALVCLATLTCESQFYMRCNWLRQTSGCSHCQLNHDFGCEL